MKSKDIEVGKVYAVKCGWRLVPAKALEVRRVDCSGFRSGKLAGVLVLFQGSAVDRIPYGMNVTKAERAKVDENARWVLPVHVVQLWEEVAPIYAERERKERERLDAEHALRLALDALGSSITVFGTGTRVALHLTPDEATFLASVLQDHVERTE